MLFSFHSLYSTLLACIGILLTISFVVPLFLIFIVPIAIMFFVLQRLYRQTSRETRRLESASRSPLYSHFNACMHGVSTIRAFLCSDRFFQQNCEKYNYYLKHVWMRYLTNRWLGIRIESIGAIVVLIAAILSTLAKNKLNSAIIGLTISFSLNITHVLTWLVRMVVEVESNLTSAERIMQYSKTETEAPAVIPETQPPEDWPQHGCVELVDLEMKYRPDLDPVLKGISVSIQPHEKVGIVGRTGAGKSSLSVALLRLVEASAGQILIDDIDISTIGLDTLRNAVTIIPQAPVLFSGTIRSNIDPFSEYQDADIWATLERVHLKDKIDNMPMKLEEIVTENGSNLSIGEKQLLCMARSVLRRSKIVIMDEATANIDLVSDQIIQQTIRQEFKDATVITIAHRLDTIIDSDKIIVMDAGRIVDFDTPHNLLSRKSLFQDLVNETGTAASQLKEQARKAEEVKQQKKL